MCRGSQAPHRATGSEGDEGDPVLHGVTHGLILATIRGRSPVADGDTKAGAIWMLTQAPDSSLLCPESGI